MKKYFIILLSIILSYSSIAQDNNIRLYKPDRIQTYTAIVTNILISVESFVPVDHYTWDLYGDGSVVKSTNSGSLSYTFTQVGKYPLKITVVLLDGTTTQGIITMQVASGTGVQQTLAQEKISFGGLKSYRPGDGKRTNYALIVNGAPEGDDIYNDSKAGVNSLYSTLKSMGYADTNIYYLNGSNGTVQPAGVDNVANLATIKNASDALASKIDEDDYLFVCLVDHGDGYHNPSIFNDSTININQAMSAGAIPTRINAAENDIKESDVKYCPIPDFFPSIPLYCKQINDRKYTNTIKFGGLNKWFLYRIAYHDSTDNIDKVILYRAKYMSNFALTRCDGTVLTDSDPFIELVVDYLDIDTDRNGIILKTEYDAFMAKGFDNDNDGKAAFSFKINNNLKNEYYKFSINIPDEDEWQQYYTIYNENIYNENYTFKYYGGNNEDYIKNIVYFDKNLDNINMDIAIVPAGVNPQTITTAQLVSDGNDSNNDGMIEGVDFNENGNFNDMTGFDNIINLSRVALYDDDVATMLNNFSCKYSSVAILCCFSGGFINDLSKQNRVVMSSTQRYYFGRSYDAVNFSNAFNINTSTHFALGDKNKDGVVSMLELFNNICSDGDTIVHVPQYDDNGDRIAYPHSISSISGGGDGCLGSKLSLTGFIGSQTIQDQPITSNRTISEATVNVNNVTIKSPASLTIEAINTTISNFTVESGASLLIDNNVYIQCQ
jgi:hypothetical protein